MKYSNIVFAACLAVLFASCSMLPSATVTTSPVTPEYTTTGEIYKLSVGMAEAEVISALGCQPYEIQFNFGDEAKILSWHYRRPHQEVKTENKNSERALTVETIKFKEAGMIHVYFENGKMTNFYTDSGYKSSKGLMNSRYELQNAE